MPPKTSVHVLVLGEYDPQTIEQVLVGLDMCLDMWLHIGLDMRLNMCLDMCLDMCIGMCLGMCLGMCIGMCIGMFLDMCAPASTAPPTIVQLSRTIQHGKLKLRSLDLSGNTLRSAANAAGLKPLLLSLKSHSSLTSLLISHTDLQDDDARTLATVLGVAAAPTRLDVSRNRFGSSGMPPSCSGPTHSHV